jgi:hypothetical protein
VFPAGLETFDTTRDLRITAFNRNLAFYPCQVKSENVIYTRRN